MLTKEQNRRLTSVEGDAPMARLMRENYWLPFSRVEALEAGATTPTKVRLLGIDVDASEVQVAAAAFALCAHPMVLEEVPVLRLQFA